VKNKRQLRPEMGLEVIRHLKEMTLLPDEGYLAGQSVSSGLFDLFVGPGEGAVYNDFDVFYHTSSNEHVIENAYSNTVQFDKQTLEAGRYGELQFNAERRYKVMASYREDLVNRVACYFNKPDMPVLDLVSTFDLNCVQVGLDLKTGMLAWTPAFARFFASRELEISQMNTPNHTAIRWFKKKAELPNVFGNDDTAMELLSLVQHCSSTDFFRGTPGEFEELSDLRWRFGVQQHELYLQYESKLSPYFNLEQDKRVRNLRYLSPRHEVEVDYLAIAKRVRHTKPLLALPRLLRLQHTAPVAARVVKALTEPTCVRTEGRQDGLFTVMASTLYHGLGYLAGNVSELQMDVVSKFINTHSCLASRVAVLPTLLLQHQAVRNMQTLETQFGRWSTGLLEVDQDFSASQVSLLDMSELRKRMTAFKGQALVPLRRRFIPSFRWFGLSVRELSTRLALLIEGDDMHHCVGGYARRVAEGDCAIFSIRGDARDPATWSTVQLDRHQGVWQTYQHRGVTNLAVPEGHQRIPLLLAVALNVTKPDGLTGWTKYISSQWVRFRVHRSERRAQRQYWKAERRLAAAGLAGTGQNDNL
jgi:hypothetical protein